MTDIARACRLMVTLAALFALVRGARGATVTLSVADGERLADQVTITARVTGFEETGVRQVAFSVDGVERGTDSSIPYTLDWDTVNESDGRHRLAAVATDMGGAAARTEVTVVVDNELSKGAEHHGRIALEALKAGDLPRATRHARRAVKVDPTNLSAARALASIHRLAKEYDKAIGVLEQAQIPEDNVPVRTELAALYVLRGDAGETMEALVMGANTGLEQHRKALLASRDALKSDAPPEQRGDAAFALRDWAGAIRAYQMAGDASTASLGSVNRLMVAYARAGRRRDLDVLLRTLKREERGDDITRAAHAYCLLASHKPNEARALIEQGVQNRVYPSLYLAACADLIIGNKKAAGEEIAALAEMRPGSPEVLLLQSLVAREPLDVRAHIVGAMALMPSWPEAYVRMAGDLIGSNRPKRMEDAETMLGIARKADRDAPDALMVTAALLMVQRRPEEAQPILARVLELDPEAPDALVGMALNCSMLDRTREITDLLARAMKVSDVLWNDVFVPKPLDFLRRVLQYRIPILMTPDVLYPTGTR